MLTRNCATNLLKKGDYNVRVTIFDNNPKYYTPEAYRRAWIETIRDSLGGGVVNSSVSRVFSYQTPNMEAPKLYTGHGAKFVSFLKNFQDVESIRITLVCDTPKTWIVMISSEL